MFPCVSQAIVNCWDLIFDPSCCEPKCIPAYFKPMFLWRNIPWLGCNKWIALRHTPVSRDCFSSVLCVSCLGYRTLFPCPSSCLNIKPDCLKLTGIQPACFHQLELPWWSLCWQEPWRGSRHSQGAFRILIPTNSQHLSTRLNHSLNPEALQLKTTTQNDNITAGNVSQQFKMGTFWYWLLYCEWNVLL